MSDFISALGLLLTVFGCILAYFALLRNNVIGSASAAISFIQMASSSLDDLIKCYDHILPENTDEFDVFIFEDGFKISLEERQFLFYRVGNLLNCIEIGVNLYNQQLFQVKINENLRIFLISCFGIIQNHPHFHEIMMAIIKKDNAAYEDIIIFSKNNK